MGQLQPPAGQGIAEHHQQLAVWHGAQLSRRGETTRGQRAHGARLEGIGDVDDLDRVLASAADVEAVAGERQGRVQAAGPWSS